VIVDAGQRHSSLQVWVELVQLLASAHVDIGLLPHDLVDERAIVGDQLRNLGTLAQRHPMSVLGSQFLDLFAVRDLAHLLFQCFHGLTSFPFLRLQEGMRQARSCLIPRLSAPHVR
jgi:hypothetical protein